MKRPVLIVFIAFLVYACSSGDDSGMVTQPPVNNNVTYTGTIKAIMDTNCISCHGNPPTNGAPMPLLNSADVKEAIENRDLISRIENGSMPPSGNLTAAQIQAVKDWEAGGFKE